MGNNSITWVGAYLVLCWLLQMVLDLTNQQFIILFLVWTALIFIITSLTHTHDIDAGEVALKAADKIDEWIQKIAWTDDLPPVVPPTEPTWSSGHKAPEGF